MMAIPGLVFLRPLSLVLSLVLGCAELVRAETALADGKSAATPAAARPAPQDVAVQLDALINAELTAAGLTPAGLARDEDFLRRVSFDIAGVPPTPQQVTRFGLDASTDKRSRVIQELLATSDYGDNWGRYWRDVVFLNATNMRARGASGVFERWLAEQLNANRPWDAIVTDMLTATGNVAENGATGLLMAHDAAAEELAAESSRIFLGIQLQCANCHDHPSDIWKREQFHELAAYFPRVVVRPIQEDGRIRGFEAVSLQPPPQRRLMGGREPDRGRIFTLLDRNRDDHLTKEEAASRPAGEPFARNFELVLRTADTNNDGKLSRQEFEAYTPPDGMRRNRDGEYYMSDLNDPASKGSQIQPKFFVDGHQPGRGLDDDDRRHALADHLTAPDNPWFARAVINRIWHEMLGSGFYMPVDDLGPTRSPVYPQVLDVLSAGFVANHYDLKWLVATIASTQAYQRQVRPQIVSDAGLPFASQTPTRLRADQLYTAVSTVLGLPDQSPSFGRRMMQGQGPYRGLQGPRQQFGQIFTFDPSTPQEDITGNIPQALFLMNSPQLSRAMSAQGRTRLGQILNQYPDNSDAASELYLLVLSREPSDQELKVCQQYVTEVGNRGEAFEDLLWTLLNSSEFLSRR